MIEVCIAIDVSIPKMTTVSI